MPNKNKFGLSRNIPEIIKKEVRRRCGFGCVVCGNAIHTYEHIDPKFADARMHDAKCITLLCGGHQLESTKGLLSKERIFEADQHPYCHDTGNAAHMLDIGSTRPKLLLGGNDFTEFGPKIVVDEKVFFQIHPPERKSKRWRLSTQFNDESGRVIAEIQKNELLVRSDVVDVEQSANQLLVFSNLGSLLELEAHPPQGISLKKYSLITPRGALTIGEQDVPNPFDQQTVTKKTVLVCKSGDSRMTFDSCQFASERGIFVDFSGSGVSLRLGDN